jgi:Domain of Unknown Function (DUF1080)
MKNILLLSLILISTLSFAQKKAEKKDWVTIFNGKDFSGWDIKVAGQPLNDNFKNAFRVENGMMRVVYDQFENFDEKFGHIYYKKPFSYYRVRFDYRFIGKQAAGGTPGNNRNSGIMLHSQSAESLTLEQTFPVSLELQLLGGLGTGERHTGNLCSPGTQAYMNGSLRPQHCIDSDSKTYDGDQWIKCEAIVLGDSVVHHVIDGDTVLTYFKTEIGGGFVYGKNDWRYSKFNEKAIEYWSKLEGTPLREGYIALQAESAPIDFKNIEVLNLVGCTNPKALNYKAYFIKSDNSNCRFKKKK